MEVNDELVEKLAHLSRLSFNEEEKKKISKDLEKMIAFVAKLGELDTTGIEPMQHIGDEKNILREDRIGPMLETKQALSNSWGHDGMFFKVPKVIKK